MAATTLLRPSAEMPMGERVHTPAFNDACDVLATKARQLNALTASMIGEEGFETGAINAASKAINGFDSEALNHD